MTVLPVAAIESLVELAHRAPPGNFCEVGVFQGGSALRLWDICTAQGRALYLYDTFTGIPFADPELGDMHKPGDFNETSLEAVQKLLPGATICAGVFPETVVDMGPLAFAHVDADQYRSIRESTLALWPQLVEGGIILFDDYGCLPGANRAVDELFPDGVDKTQYGKAYVIKGKHTFGGQRHVTR